MSNPFTDFGAFVPVWPWVLEIEGLTLHDAYLLGLLASYRGADGDGVCFPSVTTLAAKLKIDRREAQRRLKKLSDAGLIRRIERSGVSNVYMFVDPRCGTPRGEIPQVSDPAGSNPAGGAVSGTAGGAVRDPAGGAVFHPALVDPRVDPKSRSSEEIESARPRATSPKRKSAPRGQRRFPDFEPGEQHRQLAAELGVDLQLELAKFRDYEFPKAKTDASATFRNWLRNAQSFGRSGQRSTRSPAPATTNETFIASSDDSAALGV